jgi:hypothetical protein
LLIGTHVYLGRKIFPHDLIGTYYEVPNTLKDIAGIIGCEVGDFFRDEGDGSATVVCPHCGKPVTVELK